MVYFMAKNVNFMELNLPFFSLMAHRFSICIERFSPTQDYESYSPEFYILFLQSKNYLVLYYLGSLFFVHGVG